MHAAAPHPPIFFPEKENGRCDRPKERRLISSLGLERPLCLRNEDDCARRRRVSVARRFGLLLLSAVAQPLAALLPYGCGTPLAGAALPSL